MWNYLSSDNIYICMYIVNWKEYSFYDTVGNASQLYIK